jgi:hypothetical protein
MRKGMQRRLRHADMGLDASDNEGMPIQPTQSIGKGRGLKAIKFPFYDGLNILQLLTKLRGRFPKVLLFREEHGQPYNTRELYELESILNHLLLARDDGKEPLLHVNDHHERIILVEDSVF